MSTSTVNEEPAFTAVRSAGAPIEMRCDKAGVERVRASAETKRELSENFMIIVLVGMCIV